MDERTLPLPGVEPMSKTLPVPEGPLQFGGGGTHVRISVVTDESLKDHEVTLRGSSFAVDRVRVEREPTTGYGTIVIDHAGEYAPVDGGTPLEVEARVPPGTTVGVNLAGNVSPIELTGDFDYLFAYTQGRITVAGSLDSGLVDCDGHLRVGKVTGSLTAETRSSIHVGSITGSAFLRAPRIDVDHVRPAPGHNVSMNATSGDVRYRPDPQADRDRIQAESTGGTVIDLSARGQRTADARNTSSRHVVREQRDPRPLERGAEPRTW